MIELREPFPKELLPVAWKWCQEFADAMLDDNSPKSEEELEAIYHSNRLGNGRSYVVLMSDRPVGMVWFDRSPELKDGQFLGHLAFDRKGLTPREKSEMVKESLHKLSEAGGREVLWLALVDNRAFLIFLRRIGARAAGILPGMSQRNGEKIDIAVMVSEAA